MVLWHPMYSSILPSDGPFIHNGGGHPLMLPNMKTELIFGQQTRKEVNQDKFLNVYTFCDQI